MKRMGTALGLLALLLVLAACSVLYLGSLINEVTGQLEEAQACLDDDDWGQALAKTEAAHDRFSGAEFFLHAILRHSDIDQVESSFREVLAFLNGKERQPAEYAAANARLMIQLELLLEAEMPTLQNLL